jgi:hypothetical protein
MSSQPSPAGLTRTTGEIDLADYTFANQVSRPFAYLTDKLMTRHPDKSHIPLQNLQISGTDPCQADPHERSRISYLGHGVGFMQL